MTNIQNKSRVHKRFDTFKRKLDFFNVTSPSGVVFRNIEAETFEHAVSIVVGKENGAYSPIDYIKLSKQNQIPNAA